VPPPPDAAAQPCGEDAADTGEAVGDAERKPAAARRIWLEQQYLPTAAHLHPAPEAGTGPHRGGD